ncbi:MAG: patatin-like phospholipase family protein [Synergistaceae bacterium]|nr:patatin-like phospholipase family protein [Synergistaceae bacterium]MBR1601895.1 patatin-like phospholipase family protein [Synergistaceae bacterium]
MRRLNIFALVIIFILNLNLIYLNKAEAGVVLALSGGGTKGFAHIGVLEVLEENGIEIDGIVGTSMGALMGALRACGYKPDQLRKIVDDLDLPSLLSENTGPMLSFTGNDNKSRMSTISALTYTKRRGGQEGPLGILTGDKLYRYFAELTRHVQTDNFDELDISYAAIATDVKSGEKVVLRRGNLASAMRASMSIPALFEPWIIDDRYLIDGGVVSNLPVYTAQKLFPGLPVIAIDISENLAKPENVKISNYIDVVNQALTILMRRTTNEEGAAADLLITPDVSGFGMLDDTHNEVIIERGRAAALAKLEEIKKLNLQGKNFAELKHDDLKRVKRDSSERVQAASNIVSDVRIIGLPEKTANAFRKRCLSWINKPFDKKKVDDMLDRMNNSPTIEMADYQLAKTEAGDVIVIFHVRQPPDIIAGISGYATNLHPNRWLYLKGSARGVLSQYDYLSGVLRLGEQWGVDLSYQTAPLGMEAWRVNLSAQNWNMESNAGERDWDRWSFGVSRLFLWGDVQVSVGAAYEHVGGDSVSKKDDKDSVGPVFTASYDTLDIPGDPTKGHAWRISAWWPDFDEINYRLNYFKPLEVSENWRTYFRFGYAEGDLNRRAHAVYLGAAEELYSIARHPIEAERMVWSNVAFRRILNRNAMGIFAAELFGSYGYAMDKHYNKIAAPWEIGLAVNFPNNIIDIKLAVMYGSEQFKTGFFIGVPIWDHYPLP